MANLDKLVEIIQTYLETQSGLELSEDTIEDIADELAERIEEEME